MCPRLTTGSGREIALRPNHGNRQGQGATPAAFYLGLCRLRGILSPPASATVILQASNLSCYSDGAAGGPFLAAAAMALHRFASLSLKLRIDARWLCDYDLQAKPFSVAAKKISIGRGPHCRYDRSRRNHLLDCFQLLVLILVVLVYLRLKPELFLINSSLFAISAFLNHDFNYCYNS